MANSAIPFTNNEDEIEFRGHIEDAINLAPMALHPICTYVLACVADESRMLKITHDQDEHVAELIKRATQDNDKEAKDELDALSEGGEIDKEDGLVAHYPGAKAGISIEQLGSALEQMGTIISTRPDPELWFYACIVMAKTMSFTKDPRVTMLLDGLLRTVKSPYTSAASSVGTDVLQ
jgi:hypothetical protein